MKLPLRKFYHAAKVCLFLILVVTVLALFEQWRGGKRLAKAQLYEDEELERSVLEDEARIIAGLGEGGVAAYLVGEAKRLGEESEKKLALNVYLSDRIAYNRTLKDHRNPACKRVVYDAELPSASVILIFHNEPYSVVIRTIWSVLNSARRDQPWFENANYIDRETGRTMKLGSPGEDSSSPFVYLKEIILVDDNSTLPELKDKLSHYVRTRLPPDLIRIIRLPDRVGLIRARLAGARYSTGEVIVFLDSHCEVQKDWLRPLLQRIKESSQAVVVPIIDVIDASNFYYSVQDPVTFQGLMRARIRGARAARGDVLIFLDAHCEAGADWLRPLLQRIHHKRDAVLTPLIDVVDQSTFELQASPEFQVGGFTFMGHFTWIDVPEREKKRRGSDIAPTWSPTMAGGLFAINRQYYWELGAYDEQMAGWGGENLEMSFRIWQCGGTLETIPCSRVGHVFRSFHPYGMPAQSDTHGINTARMAEVWMDEYAELFYLHRPDLRNNPKIGDVTHRRVLREKLKCKSFQWYLDNVYRDKFVPVRDVYGFGRFKNPSTGLCLDTLQREGEASPLGVYSCHARLEPTQHFALSLKGELRDEEHCAEVQQSNRRVEEDGEGSRPVLMHTCHGKQRGQKWRYLPTQQLQHSASGLCLAAAAAGAGVRAARCRPAGPLQRWDIDYSERNNFRMQNGDTPSEQEVRLSHLRGQRRISRSLLSYPDNSTARRHKKRKKHKKAKKNKFILKLVRQVNGTEEHLEADVYCRHRRLYPNNTFVRDLVSVLNDKNIKVINNGRVFEHNFMRVPAPHEQEFAERLTDDVAEHVAELVTERVTELYTYTTLPATVTEAKNKALRKNTKHKFKKKVVSVAKSDLEGAGSGGDERELHGPVEKRIIIEDFVEIKPSTATPERSLKRRKRKQKVTRRSRPPATTTNAMAEAHWRSEEGSPSDEGKKEKEPSSGEGKNEKEPSSGELWPMQALHHQPDSSSRSPHAVYRTLEEEERAAARQRDKASDGGEVEANEEVPPPVKLVMRSNLTFNLGDELFRWRNDDVANILSELIIPTNTTHSPHSRDSDEAARREQVDPVRQPGTEPHDYSDSSNSSE